MIQDSTHSTARHCRQGKQTIGESHHELNQSPSFIGPIHSDTGRPEKKLTAGGKSYRTSHHNNHQKHCIIAQWLGVLYERKVILN